VRVRALHDQQRSVDVVMSTEQEDRHGEIVEQSWRLDRYRANPVVLFGHDSRSLPIGRAENVRVEGGALRGRIVLASAAANPDAERVWNLIREGVLNAVSVGFVPHEVRHEKHNGRDVIVLADNELLELSVVPIPANDEAVMQRAKAARAGLARPLDAWHLACAAAAGSAGEEDGTC
jgi:HK97 family phage prohead protease